MNFTSNHIKWLTNVGTIESIDGKKINIWKLNYSDDQAILSAWASHFRNHYCLDSEIDSLRSGTGKSRAEFLIDIIFPDASIPPGPSIRSGDFGEILTMDFLRYVLNYNVPRTRYSEKNTRNESIRGCDIIGYKIINEGKYSSNDELVIFEVKTKLTEIPKQSLLQEAINDSNKDIIRKTETLNAEKRRLLKRKKTSEALAIERFQNHPDHPYLEINGAVAILSTSLYNPQIEASSNTSEHLNSDNLNLYIFYGDQLMDLVHELYEKGSNEA